MTGRLLYVLANVLAILAGAAVAYATTLLLALLVSAALAVFLGWLTGVLAAFALMHVVDQAAEVQP